MMGSDGKYYRVDMRNSYTADQREVYGVTPSQLAVYDMSSTKKSRVVPLTRPTSSKTVIRPNSASKYAWNFLWLCLPWFLRDFIFFIFEYTIWIKKLHYNI